MFAAFPEVLNWDKVNRNFFYGDLSIQVVEAKPGMENGNKHVDYKIEFQVNGEKVVLHAYNGKQRFTISGKNHVNFVTKYIKPFFTKKVECYVSEADKFNEAVIANLGRTVKRENVKYKTTQSQSLSCNRCNQTSNSISQLHSHMKASHEKTMDISRYNERHQSTKNNSMAESIMVEDISELEIESDENVMKQLTFVTLEEETNVIDEKKELEEKHYNCDIWFTGNIPCHYQSKTPTDMLRHIKSSHSDGNIFEKSENENDEHESEESVEQMKEVAENGDNNEIVKEKLEVENQQKEESVNLLKDVLNTDERKIKETIQKQKLSEVIVGNVINVKADDLFSCDHCDFDSENSVELENHNVKNIHDIQIKNKSIIEPLVSAKQNQSHRMQNFQCHLCEYEAEESSNIDEHNVITHGFFKL